MAVYRGDDSENFRGALESVLAQELSTEVESRIYLAVDGAVPDEIDREISILGSRIHRVIRIEDNAGLANALNVLIKCLEDEEFVFRMDADDLSRPRRYQVQLDRLKQAPHIDILGTDIIEVNTATGMKREVRFARNPQEAREHLFWRVPVAHPTVCFRRHVLEKVGGYPNVRNNEDIALWFRCAELGFTFDNVHQPLYEFNIDDGFWRRRGVSKAYLEWRSYIEGGVRLDGWSWKLVLPTARLLMRLSPRWLQKWVYKSSIRSA